jgi:hypothetical protein
MGDGGWGGDGLGGDGLGGLGGLGGSGGGSGGGGDAQAGRPVWPQQLTPDVVQRVSKFAGATPHSSWFPDRSLRVASGIGAARQRNKRRARAQAAGLTDHTTPAWVQLHTWDGRTHRYVTLVERLPPQLAGMVPLSRLFCSRLRVWQSYKRVIRRTEKKSCARGRPMRAVCRAGKRTR